jgi:hypothetical protein
MEDFVILMGGFIRIHVVHDGLGIVQGGLA